MPIIHLQGDFKCHQDPFIQKRILHKQTSGRTKKLLKMLEWNGATALLPEEPLISIASSCYRTGQRYSTVVEKTNTMHRFAPLLYFIRWFLHVSAVVCHLQGASGSVWITWKIQIDMVVYHIMWLSGLCVGVSRFSLLCFLAEAKPLHSRHTGHSTTLYDKPPYRSVFFT
jgi:hypothetical protein